MPTRFLQIALVLLLCPVLAEAQAPNSKASSPQSRITEVTVYRQGALVKRTGKITVAAGDQEVAFASLEQSIRPGTVQLAIDRTVATFSLEVSTDPSRPPVEPDSLLSLRDRLAAVEDSLAVVAAERAGYQEELAVLAANRDITGEQATPANSATAVRDAARLFRELTTATQIALSRLQPRERDLQRLRQQLQERIGAIRPEPRGDIGRVTAKLIAERAGSFDFELSYIVNNASWSPDYDLYLATEGSVNADLVLGANVQQYTGVDWQNVKLTLSTSDINSRLTPPQLYPIYLGREVADLSMNVASYAKATPSAAPRRAEAEVAMDADYAYGAAATFATESSSAAARLYAIDRPFSLAATGRPSAVRLTRHTLPLALRYHVVPKRELTAYLEGIVTGWDTLNLIGATLRLHLDDRFLGDSYLNPAQNSDTLSFGLGPDPRIVVERKPLGRGSDTKLIRNRKSYDLGYEITLRNTRNVAVDVLVEDQLPVSQREEITVELESASPMPELETTTGKLSWRLSLKPATREQITVRYSVEAPKDVVVNFE